jgi:alpha-beta hydrolase superfamily lysophospholipase
MNTNGSDGALFELGNIAARPIYFPSGDRHLSGWLHLPAGAPRASTGLVICNPFGYEAICSHRSIRAFANAAASIGIAALRFDYAGTGDSEDVDPLANQIPEWTRNTVAAIDALRRHSGVSRICLLGFRTGALVASLAAVDREVVKGLIAVAPVMSGRKYLRELRTIQLAAGRRAPSGGDQAMEVSGFLLAAATVAALSETDIEAQCPAMPAEVMIIDRAEAPGARAWADALAQRGTKVNYTALSGFVRMMMTQPHLTIIPQGMIAATCEWLSQLAAGENENAGRNHEPAQEPTSSDAAFSFAASSGMILTEAGCRIPGEAALFGIVTTPAPGENRHRGVVLLNAGATHHVGPNRMYVKMARRWAEQGYVVLRLDVRGLGDSPLESGGPDCEVYPENAVDDVRAAVEYLQSHYGVNNVTLAGLCSGAFHALRAAIAHVAVNRIIMVNPLNFFWNEGRTQSDLLQLGFVHNPRMYLQQNIPTKFWRRLFSGQVNVSRLLKIYTKHGSVLARWVIRDLARALRVAVPRDLGTDLEAVASRGIDIVFLFARGEPGIALLRHQAGSSVRRLGDRCRIRQIDGADHIFSQSEPRAQLELLIGNELFSRAASGASAQSTEPIRNEAMG